MTFFLVLALECLFPIFDLSSGEWIGFSIVNGDSQTREFTVSATSPDGTVTRTGRLLMPPGAQRAALLGEILAAPFPFQSGWIRIDSESATCTSYMASGTDQAFAGSDAATALSSTIFIPHVIVNTGFMELNHADTLISLVNPNNSASVDLRLFGLDGVGRGNVQLTVPGRGSRTVRVSEAFRDVLPNNNVGGKTFQGYIRIESDVAVAAWQRVDTPLTRSMLRGKTAFEIVPTTYAIIPHFIFDGTYRSTLNLLNPKSDPVSLELTAVGDKGETIGETLRVTLAPGEALRGSVGALFRVVLPAIFPPPKIEGHIRIRQSQGGSFQLVGDVEVATDVSSVMHSLTDAGATRWTAPFAIGSVPWVTSYVIATPNELLTVQTDVQVEEVNGDGVVVNRNSFSLPPRSRRVGAVVSRMNGGYLRFSSNLPIVVIGAVGTEDGRQTDQIPALR